MAGETGDETGDESPDDPNEGSTQGNHEERGETLQDVVGTEVGLADLSVRLEHVVQHLEDKLKGVSYQILTPDHKIRCLIKVTQ